MTTIAHSIRAEHRDPTRTGGPVSQAIALITAIGGLLTGLGGMASLVSIVVIIKRTSPRERQDSAEGAANKILLPSSAKDIVDLEEQRRRQA